MSSCDSAVPAFGALIVGDEILSGRRADKHLAKLIELLGERGLALSWARYVGDDRPRLTADLRDAFASGDVVFSFGGIGATPDDHTRQCAAAALGIDLALHPQGVALIQQRIREMAAERGETADLDHPDNLHRLEMARFPIGARLIPNPYNRIPGFSVGTVHFVPGFPVMAWPMVAHVLDHDYAHLTGRRTWLERAVLVFGSMEATLTPLMVDIESRHAGVRVFSLPSVDHPQLGRHIELGVKGPVAPQVEAAYAHLTAELDRMGADWRPA